MRIITAQTQERRFIPLLRKVFLGLWAILFMTCTYANPVVNNVAAGQASISQSGNNMTINQSTGKAIINWNSFNIAQNESTHFNQPTGGIALNRIAAINGISQIYGQLSATGQIILINPAGIYFGPTAHVNVGSMIASTANMSDENFLKGNYKFEAVPGYSGAVINNGSIVAANHGLVALIGQNVENNGTIRANLGSVVLGSGNAFTFTFVGNDLINFIVFTFS
jgi:filamentous hemagglutinin family protein